MAAKKGARTKAKEFVLSQTSSLCPKCLKTLPANILERDGKVWIRKHCPKHGEVEDLYWGDVALYRKAQRFAHDGRGVTNPNVTKTAVTCPQDCGLCRLHKSHTALANIAVTTRCDLRCWYCLPYEEEILVRRGSESGFVKIGELVEEELKAGKENIGPGVFAKPKSLEVLSFKDGKTAWMKVNKLLKRSYSGDFIKVKTKTGKRVVTTTDHRFMFLNNGNLTRKVIRANDVGSKALSILKIPSSYSLNHIDLME